MNQQERIQIPDTDYPVEVPGSTGVHLFKHYQLYASIITSFDPRLDADARTAQVHHRAKVQQARIRFRGVEGLDALMELVEEWTEDGNIGGGHSKERYLYSFGKLHTILSFPGNYIGKREQSYGAQDSQSQVIQQPVEPTGKAAFEQVETEEPVPGESL